MSIEAQVIPFPSERVRRPVANPLAVMPGIWMFTVNGFAMIAIAGAAAFFDALLGDREPPPPRLVGGRYDQQ